MTSYGTFLCIPHTHLTDQIAVHQKFIIGWLWKKKNRRERSCRGNSIPLHLDVRTKVTQGHDATALVGTGSERGAGQDHNLQNLRSGEDHRSKQKQAVQPDLAQGSRKKPNRPH